MTIKEAIRRADELRPNSIVEETKSAWVCTLDGDIAELMGKPREKDPFPDDRELLMPAPDEDIYIFYLMAMIDVANRDSTLYSNDTVLFNEAYRDARARFRRNNLPDTAANWKVI